MDLESRTDDDHRGVLAMLPANLMDFSDFGAAVAQLMSMLAGAPAALPLFLLPRSSADPQGCQ